MKKRTLRKWISLLMVLTLLMSYIPVNAAEITESTETTEVTTETTEAVVQEESSEEISTAATETAGEQVEMEASTGEVTGEVSSETPTTEESSEAVPEEDNTESAGEQATTEMAGPSEMITEVKSGIMPVIDSGVEDPLEEPLSAPDMKGLALQDDSQKVIYSDGTWSGGIVWYVNDNGNKHYIFCLDKGSTMYTGKYTGLITTGYGGKDAFRLSVALNYFKAMNGGWSGKKDYGLVQQVIWNESDSELMDYINHAWRLASNNGSRSSNSSSYDSRIKAVTGVGTKSGRKAISDSLTAKKLSVGSDGYATKTYALKGAAWKYFANGQFPNATLSTMNGGAIEVIGLYEKDGTEITADYVKENYVDTSGQLHVKIAPNTGVGTRENPVTVIMKVPFPYQGANNIEYLQTNAGLQNLTFSTSANTSAYFAMEVYAEPTESDKIYPWVYVNKVDEFGNPVYGCTFLLEATAGEALQSDELPNEKVIDSSEDGWEIKEAGNYRITEIAVPNTEMQLSSGAVEFSAEWQTDDAGNQKLVLRGGYDPDLGLAVGQDNPLVKSGDNYIYNAVNNYSDGRARLVKYGNTLVSYENGAFVYEKRTLSDISFDFYAAENIYCADVLIFAKGTKVTNGFGWGSEALFNGQPTGMFSHTVQITNGSATNENGEIIISGLPEGRYYAVETSTPEGFVKSTKRHYFDVIAGEITDINGSDGIINEQVPAVCHVFKVDAEDSRPLSGGEFTIYAHVNNENYDKQKLFSTSDTVDVVTRRNLATGEEVKVSGTWVPIQAVSTDEQGMAEFTSLPAGKYLVVETKAPEGYNLAEESYEFEHTYSAEQSASGYNFEHTFKDVKKRTYDIVKHAEKAVFDKDKISADVFIYEEEPVAGVVFGIYAAEDIYNTLGEKVAEAKEQIGTCTTDENGIATYSDILFAGNYYFKELKTADDERYVLDDTEYSFSVSGESEGVINEEPIVNELYKGSIKVIKTDGVTKAALSNVEFKLYDETQENVLGTYVTDEKGEIHIDKLPVGTYYLQESKAKKNYRLDDTLQEVIISKENLDHEIAMTNEEYKGSIKVIKTDGVTKAALSGVEFKLYDETQENVLGTYVTDEKGEIFIDNLSLGTYYLQEAKTRDNYRLDDTLREVIISEENLDHEIAITNEEYKGSIKVIKTDGVTKTALSGVEFKLYDETQKNVLGTYVTDEKGEIFIDNLALGTYYLQESKTKKGYKLVDEMIEVVISVEDLHKQVELENYPSDTRITIKTDTTYSGTGRVRTGDMSPIGLILLLFFMSSFGVAYWVKKNGKLQPLSVRAKKFMAIALVLTGVICLGGLTSKAAAELKELSSKELENAEYNGTVYKYALQKQYETSNPDDEMIFDEELDGMKLAEVQYETIDTILQKKTIETTKDYKDLLEKDESNVAETVTIDGNVYELQDITWSEVPNMETVNYTVDYGYLTAEPKSDATYEYTYTSPVTKKENTVTLPFVRMEKGSESWVDGFTATVTFHNLDGLYFNLGNHEFKYNPDKISLQESDYKELVKMLGYDTSKYRLNSIAWFGEEYKKNGQTCRDAKASGQQYATIYKAYYEDTVENGKIYTAHATYACEVDVPAEEAAPTYVMQATGYYEDASVWSNIITFVTEHKAVSVVFVGFVLLIIILVIMFMWKRPKKVMDQAEETYTE